MNKWWQKKCYSQGMTLVEVLVTISIIGLMLVMGIPAFRTFGQVNELRQNAEYIQDAILQTQNFAFAPQFDKPVADTHYIFQTNVEENSYSIGSGQCDDPATAEISTVIKETNLPEDNLQLLGESQIVCYSIANQGRISYPESGEVEVILEQPKMDEDMNTQTIVLNVATGQVIIK